MKTLVVYKSVSGFTKKYAEWISEALDADLSEAALCSAADLLPYDTIVFGGSLHAVGINGIRLIKDNMDSLRGKHLVVFATGASPDRTGIPDEIIRKNFPEEERENIKFFYFRGGFNFGKLDFPNKILMTLMKWKLMAKKDRSPDERGMLAAYSRPLDFTRKDYIEALVGYVKSLGRPA